MNIKKSVAAAAAVVALLGFNVQSAHATSDINVGLENPVTHVTDVQTVPSTTSVADLRNLFVGTLGYGVAKHSLTLNGKRLADSDTLAQAGINDGNWLGVGSAIGGLNVEVYRIANGDRPTDSEILSKCSGPNVPTTVGTVNFQWGDGSVFNCQNDHVLVKFKGYVGFPTDRTVSFCTDSDDGNRVTVDGNVIVDQWVDQGSGGYCSEVNFTANVPQSFEYDFYEHGGGAFVNLTYSYTENGTDWTNNSQVPTSAFINGSNWADESQNVITGIDSGSHKLTNDGKAAVQSWYESIGNQTDSIKLVGNTDNNSSYRARIEIASVRNYLKKLGYTGKFQLVAHNGDRGNSDNGNVDEVILVASNTGAADFWTASGPGFVAIDHNRAQFSFNAVGTVTHVTSVKKAITSATVTSIIDNSIDNSINAGSRPDNYSIVVSLRDAADHELASNDFASSELHKARAVSVNVDYNGYVDHVVTTVNGFDVGYWDGYYGPIVYGASVKTTN